MKAPLDEQKKYKKLIIMTIVFVIIIGYDGLNSYLKVQNAENYYKNFNLTFSGIVYDKEFVERAEGIIRINLSTSNVTKYDVRDSITDYYCILKNGKAEIFQRPYTLINIGDSVFINGKEKMFKLYRERAFILEELLPYPTNFNAKSRL